MRKLKIPNTYVIIACILVLCAVATWFVPGGEYVQAEDGTLSYRSVDAAPQTWQVFTAIYHGFVRQAGIIIFILVVGGAFWLLNATGAVSAGISRFITASYTNAVFDRFINPRIEGAKVNQGIYTPEEDEDEDEENGTAEGETDN